MKISWHRRLKRLFVPTPGPDVEFKPRKEKKDSRGIVQARKADLSRARRTHVPGWDEDDTAL